MTLTEFVNLFNYIARSEPLSRCGVFKGMSSYLVVYPFYNAHASLVKSRCRVVTEGFASLPPAEGTYFCFMLRMSQPRGIPLSGNKRGRFSCIAHIFTF